MNLPTNLIDDVKAGRVILFLGAGASVGAVKKSGEKAPIGTELGERIATQFLSPQYRDRSLSSIAELAISESSFSRVQDFIAEQFTNLIPANFHKSICTLKWRAIATTNYDLVVEDSYDSAESNAQELVPIRSDEDRVDEKLKGDGQVAYFKLHGCITATHRTDLPLILTVDQYVSHLDNRNYTFSRFEDLARQYPVVFVGYQFEDVNIRAILSRISEKIEDRPRYYLVTPGLHEIDVRFWESKKVTVLPGTYEEFVEQLDKAVEPSSRSLLTQKDTRVPIRAEIPIGVEIPPSVVAMLDEDMEYVHRDMGYKDGDPKQFYRGFDLGWYPIANDLDLRRRITDTLLNDVILRQEEDRPAVTDLYVVKSAAGTGKSVLLRRLAWEAATEADSLSLYVRPNAEPVIEAVAELQRLSRKRLFIHWDNAAVNADSIRAMVEYGRRNSIPLTVITAERSNEWNVYCDAISSKVTDDFELRRMSESEVSDLVGLLEKHDSLGPNLISKSHTERVSEFVKNADRRLLVALHEATTGIPFSDILENEYRNIHSTKAQQLYLTVCVLNRLRTPVRAGLISRVHDIDFEDFKKELFDPLEQVVSARLHRSSGDYMYTARHPEIAQLVFTRILSDRDNRLNEYLRIVSHLNLAYDTDRDSFRGLLRARSLHELFPDYNDVRLIFEKAEIVGYREAYFYQQRANYERIRPGGNFSKAQEDLERAMELDPYDLSVIHTLAELYRSMAESSSKKLVRQNLRGKAESTLRFLTTRRNDEYAQVSLIRLGIDRLRDTLSDSNATEREIDDRVREVDRLLMDAHQKHPRDMYVLTAEADFSAILADSERTLSALKRASLANPRDPYVANRLGRILFENGRHSEALQVLRTALDGNRGDMRMNFQYAEMLRASESTEIELLVHHYERAFTKGDRNIEAQFWFARFGFECSDRRIQKKAIAVFRDLRDSNVSHEQRTEIRVVAGEGDREKIFQGTVERLEQTFGYVNRDAYSDVLFMHCENTRPEVWRQLSKASRVCFAIGYSLCGPQAIKIELLNR